MQRNLSSPVMIIAPRFLERLEEIETAVRGKGIPYIRRSRFNSEPRAGKNLIILDSMGELAKVYSLATVAIVSYIDNYRSAAALFLAKQAAIQVADADELSRVILGLINNKEKREQIGENAAGVIRECQDISLRTYEMILPIIFGKDQILNAV